nr:hypothetical protein [Bacteroidota bacterium]
MKKFYFVLVLLFISANLFAQDISQNKLFVEAGGSALIYSINYERLIVNYRDINMPFRIGFSVVLNSKYRSEGYACIPLSLGIIKKIKANHFIETRIFLTTFTTQIEDYSSRGLGDSSTNYTPEMRTGLDLIPGYGIGYRYQPEKKGLFL